MRVIAYQGSRVFEILSLPLVAQGRLMNFQTLAHARSFVHDLRRDALTFQQVRHAMAPFTQDVDGMSDDSRWTHQIADAILDGDVRVFFRNDRVPLPELEDPIDPIDPTVDEKTWIEIELVDQDGNPVPAKTYRITLADGSVREGRLNAGGFAREDDLDPGQCTVEFPEFDRDAIEMA